MQCENLRCKTYIIICTYLYIYISIYNIYAYIYYIPHSQSIQKKKMLLRSYYVLTSFTKTRFFFPRIFVYTYLLITRTVYTFFKSHTQCYFYTSCLFCGFCRHEVYYFKITTLNTAVPDRVIYTVVVYLY